jgi:hypothetical protein
MLDSTTALAIQNRPPDLASLDADSTQIHCPSINILVQPWHERVFVIRVASNQYPVMQNIPHDRTQTRSITTVRPLHLVKDRVSQPANPPSRPESSLDVQHK